jgi:SPP1 gp7 family putative phage head morphogenesis protein
MTSPVYLPVYPDEVPPPADQQGMTPAEKVAVAALAAWLALAAARTAVRLPKRIADLLTAAGLPPRAVRLAGQLALTAPLPGRARTAPGPATASPDTTPDTGHHRGGSYRLTTAHQDALIGEPAYRAQFLVNSAKRLAVAHDMGVGDIQLAKERAYLAAHRAAARNRLQVAERMDTLAQDSPWLEWHAVLDEKTTPDCRAMNGQIFTLDRPPAIGWPGAVHPRCRCSAIPFGVGLFGAQSTVTAGVGAP